MLLALKFMMKFKIFFTGADDITIGLLKPVANVIIISTFSHDKCLYRNKLFYTVMENRESYKLTH